MQNNGSEIIITLGGLCDGTPVSRDLKRLPHLLIGGSTEGAAHNYLSALLIEAAAEKTTDALRILAVNVDGRLNALPHLLSPVITDDSEAETALLWLTREADRRFALLWDAGVRNVDAYNENAKEPMCCIIAAVSRLQRATKKAKEYISYLAAKARAVGIYVIACTDELSAKTVSGIIKANIPSRIALRTDTRAQSRLLLDCNGAEKLGEDELLLLPVGYNVPERLVITQISEQELDSALSEIQSAYPPAGAVAFTAEKETEASRFIRALTLAVNNNGITVAALQRGLHIGYKKAAMLMQEMENAGYVAEYEGQKPRKVLISKDELIKLTSEEKI